MLTSLFLLFIEYHSDHLNIVALRLYVWLDTSQFNSSSIYLGHRVIFCPFHVSTDHLYNQNEEFLGAYF